MPWTRLSVTIDISRTGEARRWSRWVNNLADSYWDPGWLTVTHLGGWTAPQKHAAGVQKGLSNVTSSISGLWPEQSWIWSCTPETLDCDLPGLFVRSGICTLKLMVLHFLMFFESIHPKCKFCLWSLTWSSFGKRYSRCPPGHQR